MIAALEPNNSIRAVYSCPFKLIYNVILVEHQLSMALRVENSSQQSDTLEFQALLHNYIRAPADEVKITPLKGLTYFDKTESTDESRAAPKIETREEVTVSEYTDSVYEDGPLDYKVSWPHGFLNLKVKTFKDVVVWNPQHEGRKIVDMEPDGW
jgi:glucose-6-phosphate 1-epimerase